MFAPLGFIARLATHLFVVRSLRALVQLRFGASSNDSDWPETLWRAYLTGDHSQLGKLVHAVKRVFSALPGDRRCRVCNAPFVGPASMLTGMPGFGAGSSLNPTLCVRCEHIVKEHGVGIDINVTLLFADIRGSTALAEKIGPSDFHKLIDRFYKAATEVLVDSGALIEKLIGDEAAGIYTPGISGPHHAACAVEAARSLLGVKSVSEPLSFSGRWQTFRGCF